MVPHYYHYYYLIPRIHLGMTPKLLLVMRLQFWNFYVCGVTEKLLIKKIKYIYIYIYSIYILACFR